MDKNGDLSLSDFGCARYVDEPIEQPVQTEKNKSEKENKNSIMVIKK